MYSGVKSCNEGIKALQCDDYETAVSKFTKCLLSTSDSTDRCSLLQHRSTAYLELDQYDAAISDAKEYVKLRPRSRKGYLCWAKALEKKGDYPALCNVYINAIKRGDGLEKALLKPLIIANDKHNVMSNEFMEVLLLGNSKYCEKCRESNNLLRCSRCRVVYYCGTDHQKEDWGRHRTQCSFLADAHNFLLEEKSLRIMKDMSWLVLRKKFTSLTGITDWSRVWKHLECSACTSDVFYARMSESLSWSLNLVKAICKFNLADRKKLVIHILGADDTYNKEGYYSYFTGFFPFPELELVLIGPDLLQNTTTLKFTSASGSKISIYYVSDVWHNFTSQETYKPPDLIFASHPGIHEDFYDWKPTLKMIISQRIPTALTMWHKEDFISAIRVLENRYNADILFDGPSPFPSLVKRYARKSWNDYGIQVMNSYWLGIKGVKNSKHVN